MISYIIAMDKNRLIGNGNKLPWHLPADLAFFKRVTTGHTVIMGRKTYESIGKPLPNRRNIILSTNKDFTADGCIVLHSVQEVLQRIDGEEEAFVIGGAEIYRLFAPFVDKMYITMINDEFSGDTYFPAYDPSEWQLIESEQGITDEKNPYDFTFTIWQRTGGGKTSVPAEM